jgi:hypothetical protein
MTKYKLEVESWGCLGCTLRARQSAWGVSCVCVRVCAAGGGEGGGREEGAGINGTPSMDH